MQPDEKVASAVLKIDGGNLGRRRLPLAPPANSSSSDGTANVRDDLRHHFSQELALLEEEARQQGLELARRESEDERSQIRAKLEAEFTAKSEAMAREQQRLMHRLQTLCESMERERERLTETLELVVGRLALSAVQQVLGRQAVSGSLVADIARQAIESYRLTPIRIQVSETDYRTLMGKDSELKGLLQIDHDAAEGSCMIDFGQGQLDASLETQLSALREILLGQEAHDVA